MAYVPGCSHDLFISYAHADNTGGWVRQFARRLKDELDRQLRLEPTDRQASAEVWSDGELPQFGPLGEALTAQVKASALLLIVLSESSAQSEWCRHELKGFAQANGDAALRRLFIVQKEPVAKWPESLCSPDGKPLLYRSFLEDGEQDPLPINTPTGDLHPGAEKRLRKICRDLMTALRALRAQRTEEAVPDAPATIFLAPTADADSGARRDLVDGLQCAQVSYRDVPSDTALQDLETSVERYFVQILDRSDPFRLPSRLVERARQLSREMFLWWSDRDLSAIETVPGSYGALLKTLRADGALRPESFSDFVTRLVAGVRGRSDGADKIPCFVAIRSAPEDGAAAAEFKKVLAQASAKLRIHGLLVDPNAPPSEAHRNSLGAHGFAFVWGKALLTAAGDDLNLLLEEGPPRSGYFPAESLAYYDPRHVLKPSLTLRSDVASIECYSDSDQRTTQRQLRRFVEQLERAIEKRNGPLFGSGGAGGNDN